MSKQSNHPETAKKNAPGPEEEKAQATENIPNQGEKTEAETPAAENQSAAAGGEKALSAEDKIAELEAKLAEVNDQYLRKAADFENFRKRMNREKQDAIDYANQSLLLDLIQIMDDFELALKSAEAVASGEFKAFYDGFSLIEKRLCTQLENKWGLKRHISAGQPFDPNFHEAVLMEKSAEIDEPVVMEEYNKCYTLKERVVRSAKVKVLMPEKPADGEAKPSGENG